ncbi:hypothetical protein Pfo_014715 [Paulownia fortunei]|nr:hypothetical protein Pfo_014715 [Paulownia fortunei]
MNQRCVQSMTNGRGCWLLAAVLGREQFRQLCRDNSSTSSMESSSDFSLSSPFHDVLSLDFSGPGAGSSSSHQQDHRQALIAESVFGGQTASINTSRLRKVVIAVDDK